MAKEYLRTLSLIATESKKKAANSAKRYLGFKETIVEWLRH
jgi:hypothetical protein